MGERWSNWSGSITVTPARLECPDTEARLQHLVTQARQAGQCVRAVGTGHSSTGILECDGTLVSLEALTGVVEVDAGRHRARVRPGTTLDTLGAALYEHDLALPNYGDVATQTIDGAIGTGTHGTGPREYNLSRQLVGARLATADGDVVAIDESDPDLLRAARVALGTLGIFSELTLQLVPTFDVERREYAIRTDAALAQLEELVGANRSFDFYWYPRRDDIKLRLVNPVGGGSGRPDGGRLLERREGPGHEVIPTHSGIPHRFEECEYAVPAKAGPDCFRRVRERILDRWRREVGWRVLYRTVAGDDADLSPAHGRPTVTISLHQNASLPWEAFFRDIEPIFLEHGGRPHWAKKHHQRAAVLRPRYPRWDAFTQVRRRLDPDGVFLTPYLRGLLGVQEDG